MNDPKADSPAIHLDALRRFTCSLRARYQETDAQGHVHHATYPNYFEYARVEMLRAAGIEYRELEANGALLIVTELSCQYHAAAYFDDLLTIHVETVRARGTRIRHEYKILRAEQQLVTGHTVVACVSATGRPQPLPEFLRLD